MHVITYASVIFQSLYLRRILTGDILVSLVVQLARTLTQVYARRLRKGQLDDLFCVALFDSITLFVHMNNYATDRHLKTTVALTAVIGRLL